MVVVVGGGGGGRRGWRGGGAGHREGQGRPAGHALHLGHQHGLLRLLQQAGALLGQLGLVGGRRALVRRMEKMKTEAKGQLLGRRRMVWLLVFGWRGGQNGGCWSRWLGRLVQQE